MPAQTSIELCVDCAGAPKTFEVPNTVYAKGSLGSPLKFTASANTSVSVKVTTPKNVVTDNLGFTVPAL
jgi:hypothetical protein